MKKTIKKILFTASGIILLAVIAGFIYVRHLGTRALPDYNATVCIPGMKGEVMIYRDAFAIPHIYAQNEADLYCAVGYIMAQDRLWQMDLIRRVTMGRLAEIFGEDYLETDELMRALRISAKSKKILQSSNPRIRDAVAAFCTGVNRYIEEKGDDLPPEFAILGYTPDPWEMFHSINLIGYMAWDLSFAWDMEIFLHKLREKIPQGKFNKLLPRGQNHRTFVIPGFVLKAQERLAVAARKPAELGLGVFHGSNNWAVSGSKSTTGKPLFANDMHLGLFAPGIWYQVHQVIENKEGKNEGDLLNVTGLALPGAPFVVAGHNERIAWGMTNVMVDDLDFYLETINPNNPDQYWLDGEWHNMTTRLEEIKIKGGRSVTREIKYTHRGPIVSRFHDIKSQAISARWLGSEPSDEIRSVYLLNRARNWEEFRAAVKTFIAVSQNIAYADVDGNIGIQVCAGVPIRPPKAMRAISLAHGETSDVDWLGLVPFEELPYQYNPACGHVSSANNCSVDKNYPYYISHWFMPPHRIDRIRELLEEKPLLGIEDFQAMQADWKSKHVETFLPGIIAELESGAETGNAGALSPIERQVLDILKAWDGVMNPGAAAPLVFDQLYLTMAKNLVTDEIGPTGCQEFMSKRILVQNLLLNTWAEHTSNSSPAPMATGEQDAWCDDVTTTAHETFSTWIRKSFRETVEELKVQYGSAPGTWEWGRAHQFTLHHPLSQVKILDKIFGLDRGPFPVGGSFHTVCPYSYSLRAPYSVIYGASHRHIYSTADWDTSLTVIPTGISGIPASPFYCDQTPLYISNQYHPDYFSKELVVKNAHFVMKITGQPIPLDE